MKDEVFTGFKMIDEDFGGLRAGEVTLIGGRPAMGKTSLALQIAMNAARTGKKVLFYTAETSPVALELRLVSMNSDISSRKLREWDLTDAEWEVFKKQIREIKELPLRFVHADLFDMIKFGCTDETKTPVDLIILDYVQLIHNSVYGSKDGTQEQTSLELLKKFKKLAKKQGVPVVVVSQLSRSLERRKDKRPRVEDFRIENMTDGDYDQAFLIYREAYYDMNARRDVAELTGVGPRKKLKVTKELQWNTEKGVFGTE